MTQEEYTAFVAEYGVDTIPSFLYTYGDSTWADLLTNYSGTNITYDELGNPLNWVGGRGITLTWENGRQLKQYKRGAVQQYDYTYNADGLRTGKTVTQSGSVTKSTEYYIVNGQYIGEVSNIGGTDYVIAYVYDENGAPAGINVNGSAYYFAKNLQGDIVAIMSYTGNVIARYFYDAWGDLISITDGNGNAISSSTHIAKLNPFRYRGYMYDDESGFYYLRSRYYDPSIGRFLNADGLVSTGTGLSGYNMFAYCNDNPVMFVDSNGKGPLLAIIGLAVCLVGVLLTVTSDTNKNVKKEKLEKEQTDLKKVQEKYNEDTIEFIDNENEKVDGKLNIIINPNYYDKAEERTDPNIRICESHNITDKTEMKVILDVVMNHPKYDTEIFTRSASSYIVEWRGHNVAYRIASFFNISGWMSRSESVDFNEYEDRMIIWEVLAPYGY